MWSLFFTLIIDNIIWILILSIIIIWYSYFYIIETLELFWFSFYVLITFTVLFLIFVDDFNIIITYFFNQVLEPIIVLDPTLFTYSFLYFIVNFCMVLITSFFCLMLYLYCTHVIYSYNLILYIYFSIIMIYYINIVFWIIKYDLFFSNWFSFSYLPKFSILFDFQPDLEKFLYFFWLDYWELFLLSSLLYFLIYYIYLQGYFIEVMKNNLIQKLVLIVYVIFNIYFFSEFNFINDCILFVFTILMFIIIEISLYFIYYLKQYKR